MKRFTAGLKSFFLLTLPTLLVLLIFLEVASRVFFPGSYAPRAFFDEDILMLKFNREKGEEGMLTIGSLSQQRGRWRVNNAGWNSPVDYYQEKKPGITRIAVIGDSYIEAFQVDIDKSYPYVLSDLLGNEYEAYSFGFSGAPLSQYLHIARYAEHHYNPDIFIINLVHNDFDESIAGLYPKNQAFLTVQTDNNQILGEVLPVPPQRRFKKMPLSFLFRNSSFIRYLYSNLRIKEMFRHRPDAGDFEMNVVISTIEDHKDEIRLVTHYLLERFSDELGHKQVIFIMDGPRFNIYKNNLEESRTWFLHEMMEEMCDSLSMPFVDLTEYMVEDYRENQKRYESPYDNHWDVNGHSFVAKVLYDYLNQNMN